MKNIFKLFSVLAVGALTLASCQEAAEPLASNISVDTPTVAFAKDGGVQTIKVTADGPWTSVCPNWVAMDPVHGYGDTEVTLSTASNFNGYSELQGPKADKIFVFGNTASCEIAVSQEGDIALDTRHTYKKVTSVTAGKSYLLVFKDSAGKLQAATPVTSNYGYLYPVEVSANDAGDIELNTGNNAFTLVAGAVSGTFNIQQADKRLLYVKGYNSFNANATYAPDGGYDYTVAFDDKGFATITSTLESKYIQYSNSYKSAGCYADAQDGASMPMLYEDAKAASEEVLMLDNTEFTVGARQEKATFKITASGSWEIRNHDSWIQLSQVKGTGNATITATLTPNENYRYSRTAEIIVKGTEVSATLVLTQKEIFVCKTAADINSQLTSTSSSAPDSYEADFTSNNDAVVTFVSGSNVFIQDKTGGILYYKSGSGLKPGQKVSGKFSGTGYLYSGLPEITKMDGAEFSDPRDGYKPVPVELTVAELSKNIKKYLNMWVTCKDVEVTTGCKASSTTAERKGVITQDGKTIALFVQIKDGSIDLAAGSKGVITGIATINNGTAQIGLWNADCFTPSNAE